MTGIINKILTVNNILRRSSLFQIANSEVFKLYSVIHLGIPAYILLHRYLLKSAGYFADLAACTWKALTP